MRTFAAVPAALLLAAACADLPTAGSPAVPAPAPGAFRAGLTCTASVARGQVSCASDAPDGSASFPSLIIGGQNVYLRLDAGPGAYNPSDSTFQIDVTVQNLMTQAFGTPDGTTDTGLTVFFYTGPDVTAGTGSVSVDNEDGNDIFLGGPEPYFSYEGVLYTGFMTEPRPWRFKADPEVETFQFKVFVQGQIPHEASLLLFRPWLEDPEVYVNGIWGPSASEVFAVGDFGGLVRYTGGAWVSDEALNENQLWDVRGTSATDVFAVGDFGTIVHWNGTLWEEMDSGLGCGCESLYGVWAAAPDDAWAVGDGGLILHYDGTQWVPGDTMPVEWLGGVWGSAANDVFAVGDDGGIFHYDGTAWTPMESGLEGSGEYLNSVWGLSSTDVYAAASNGVLHYDGVEWSPMPDADTCEHFSVWGSASDDLFVANVCGIEHWDGSTWAYMDPGGFATELWGFGPRNVLTNSDQFVYRGTR
jgi:hypothetical protein